MSRLVAEGKEPAEGKQIMLGITKASLATEFLPVSCFLPGDNKGSDRSCNQG